MDAFLFVIFRLDYQLKCTLKYLCSLMTQIFGYLMFLQLLQFTNINQGTYNVDITSNAYVLIFFFFEVAPFGFNNVYTVYAEKGQQFIFSIPFFNFEHGYTVELFRTSTGEQIQPSLRWQIYVTNETHDMEMYSVTIQIKSFLINLNITEFVDDDYGKYFIVLSDDVAKRTCHLHITNGKC